MFSRLYSTLGKLISFLYFKSDTQKIKFPRKGETTIFQLDRKLFTEN